MRRAMGWRQAGVVYAKELVDALRDRRTLLVVLGSSVLLGPIVLVVLSASMATVQERAEDRLVLVDGLERAPGLRNFLQRQTWRVDAAPAGYEARLRASTLRTPVVIVPPDFEAALLGGRAPMLDVATDSGNTRANESVATIQRLLLGYGHERAMLTLALRGVSPDVIEPLRVGTRDLAGPHARGVSVTGVLPFFVIMAVLVGALNAALDTTAGERERGSLEPLLGNPVPRWAVVAGKWAAVASLGMSIAVLSCVSFIPAQRLFRSDELAALFQYGWREAALFLVLVLPLSAALAAVLMAVAAGCRTFKEAQANTAVVTLGVSLLPIATLLGNGEDAPWQRWVPGLAQYTLMTRVLKDEPVTLLQMSLPLGVCAALTVAALGIVGRRLGAASG